MKFYHSIFFDLHWKDNSDVKLIQPTTYDLVQSLWESHLSKSVSSEIAKVKSRSQIRSSVVVT